jgi:hypothetical protein
VSYGEGPSANGVETVEVQVEIIDVLLASISILRQPRGLEIDLAGWTTLVWLGAWDVMNH